MPKRVLTVFGAAVLVSLVTTAVTQTQLFQDESLSERDEESQARRAQGADKALRALDELQLFYEYQAVKNDCAGLVSVDRKASSGDATCQYLLATLSFRGVCVELSNADFLSLISGSCFQTRIFPQFRVQKNRSRPMGNTALSEHGAAVQAGDRNYHCMSTAPNKVRKILDTTGGSGNGLFIPSIFRRFRAG
jgi:hypothetical protein